MFRPRMTEIQRQWRIRRGELSSQEVTGLLVSLRAPLRDIQIQFSAETVEAGQRLFEVKRCSDRHRPGWRLRQLTGWITTAADRQGVAHPQLSPRQMHDLTAFLSGESAR